MRRAQSRAQPGLIVWMTRLSVAIVIAALLLPLIFIVLINSQDQRSFVISAQSSYVTLTFGDAQPDWRLPDALICEPVEIPRLDASDICGAAFRPRGAPGEVLVSWYAGETISLTLDKQSRLRIASLGDSANIPTGGYIITSPDFWDKTGTMLFHARVTLGQTLSAGTRAYLWSGDWQARETGASTFFFRPGTEIVKQGELTAGTRVSIVDTGGATVMSNGHIARRQSLETMDIAYITDFANSAVSAHYFGVLEPILTRPDWVDVTLTSPALIALAAIFPLLASLGLFLIDTLRRTQPRSRPESEGVNFRQWFLHRTIREARRRK